MSLVAVYIVVNPSAFFLVDRDIESASFLMATHLPLTLLQCVCAKVPSSHNVATISIFTGVVHKCTIKPTKYWNSYNRNHNSAVP